MPDEDKPESYRPPDLTAPASSPPAPPAEGVEEKPQVTTYDVIAEALARNAARRKPSGPPKELQVPPTLPRQPKPYRNRVKKRRK